MLTFGSEFKENLTVKFFPPQSISECEMAGLKVFLALCCIAATSAVQLERKPFKRLIPADVLRGESIQFILDYLDVRRCRFDVLWGELGLWAGLDVHYWQAERP